MLMVWSECGTSAMFSCGKIGGGGGGGSCRRCDFLVVYLQKGCSGVEEAVCM